MKTRIWRLKLIVLALIFALGATAGMAEYVGEAPISAEPVEISILTCNSGSKTTAFADMPVQVLLRRVLIQYSNELLDSMGAGSDEMAAISIQVRYVTIVVATLPIIAVYPLLQKYFVKGVMIGAVKG